MPVGTPFKPGQSGNPAGRPIGAVNLSTRIQNALEDAEDLPSKVRQAMERVVGKGKKLPVDALIAAAYIYALNGDKAWADWLSHNGYGKPKERLEHTGGDGGPIAMTIAWEE